jgi:response regulator RpfG family c-di-GMP phosphodiesterase
MPVDTPAGALEFLLVSSEALTVNAVGAALKDIGAVASYTRSTDEASRLITTEKVDGVILDVGIKNALGLIASMRKSKNARAFAFVCVSNDAEEAVALKGGANALLAKPLDPDAIASKIGSFKSIIASERRRYRRHDVTLPAVITLGENTYQGIVENISQGGMAVRLPCLLPNSCVVEFSFELQLGIEIEGSALLRWTRPDGLAGIEFSTLPPRCKKDLMAWLREQAANAS